MRPEAKRGQMTTEVLARLAAVGKQGGRLMAGSRRLAGKMG
jgi:hypothetical protein